LTAVHLVLPFVQAVATRFLGDIEMADDIRVGCIQMCQEFHTTTQKLSARFHTELERHNYVTPTSYLEMINTFKVLLDNKRKEVLKVRGRMKQIRQENPMFSYRRCTLLY
jgi:dynein heavy chain, axonemal